MEHEHQFTPVLESISVTVPNIQYSTKWMYFWLLLSEGIDTQAPFSIIGYGGLDFSFCGISEYLHGLISVYDCPIIAGIKGAWIPDKST